MESTTIFNHICLQSYRSSCLRKVGHFFAPAVLLNGMGSGSIEIELSSYTKVCCEVPIRSIRQSPRLYGVFFFHWFSSILGLQLAYLVLSLFRNYMLEQSEPWPWWSIKGRKKQVSWFSAGSRGHIDQAFPRIMRAATSLRHSKDVLRMCCLNKHISIILTVGILGLSVYHKKWTYT